MYDISFDEKTRAAGKAKSTQPLLDLCYSMRLTIVRRESDLDLRLMEENNMSVAKILEISARSGESFEDAIRQGIARANATINHVEGAWVEEQKVVVHEGKVEAFEVIMKVTFLLED